MRTRVVEGKAHRVSAEGEGFEPSEPFSSHDFQSCTFGHSVTPPEGLVEIAEGEGFEPPVLAHI